MDIVVLPGEFMPTPHMALAVRTVTEAACLRVARVAFELARGCRRRVTAVHKADVLRVSDGLFLRSVREVARDYPDVALQELIGDAVAALLVRDATRFDVIVTTNMFGDILSDEAAELSGSLGLGGAINANERMAVAQAQHSSAPDFAGKGIANPTSLILSAAMMLDWLGVQRGAPTCARPRRRSRRRWMPRSRCRRGARATSRAARSARPPSPTSSPPASPWPVRKGCAPADVPGGLLGMRRNDKRNRRPRETTSCDCIVAPCSPRRCWPCRSRRAPRPGPSGRSA